MTPKNKKQINILVFFLSAIVTTTLAINTHVDAAIEIAPELQVNGTTTSTGNDHIGQSQVANDQYGNSIVVWTATDSGGNGRIFFRLYDEKGTPLTTQTEVASAQTGYQKNPDVAMDQEGNFFITWEVTGTSNDTLGVWLAVFRPDGTQADQRTLVQASATNPSIAAQFEPEGTTTRIAVSYSSTITGQDIEYSVYDINYDMLIELNIYFVREVTVTNVTGDQDFSDIAMNNSKDVALTWNDTNSNYIKYKLYDNDGLQLFAEGNASETTVNSGARPAISANQAPASLNLTKNFSIAYDGTFDSGTFNGVGVRTISCPYLSSCFLNGTVLIANTEETDTLSYPDISSDYFGNFTVVWEHPTFDAVPSVIDLDIRGQSFKYDGKQIGENFDVNTSLTSGYQRYPSIGMNKSGEYSIAFTDQPNTDVYQSIYNTEIFKVSTETLENSVTTGQQDSASTDISENSLIVTTWKDYSDNTIKFTLKDMSENVIAQNVTVASGATIYNPKVAFYKDASGTYLNNFIITWEGPGSTDTDIFYRTYDATGTPTSAATLINQATSGNQTTPDLDAGYYPNFAATWKDAGYLIKGSFYDGTSFYEQTIATCSALNDCNNPSVAINHLNNHLVYAWDKINDNTDIFAQQAVYDDSALILQGSNFEVDNTKKGIYADVAFTTNGQFLITYTSHAAAPANQSIWTARFDFALGSTPTLLDEFEVTPTSHQTNPSNSKISSNISSGNILIVWADNPTVSTDDNIYGVFYEYQSPSTLPTQYGPIFQINSTIESTQALPSIGMNSEGHINVSWEGNVDQPSATDTYGIANQMLHSPFITLTANELQSVCQQEVTSGIRTLTVPDTIYFPIADVSTTEEQTNDISIRASDNNTCGNNCGVSGTDPCPCGGDTIKYIEVTDEAGQDFDLTVTSTNFISEADSKSYIKADQHFKVRNFDQQYTEDLASDCGTDPDKCFAIQECSIPELTTFSLDSSTENFVTMDQNRTLAIKRETTENPAEVGTWRFYPEFELTIPKIIPAGNHAATITFTIN